MNPGPTAETAWPYAGRSRGLPLRFAVLVLLLAIAAMIRFQGLEDESIWFDESVTALYTNQGIHHAMRVNAGDSTPPLYFMGLSLWRTAFGMSDGVMRGYSAAWSWLGLLALLALAHRAGGWRLALPVMAMAAVNAEDVYFAQEARMYAQGAALATLSSLCLVYYLFPRETAHPRSRLFAAAAYVVVSTALMLTHYVAAMVLAAHGFYVLTYYLRRHNVRELVNYGFMTVGVFVLFLPWAAYVRQTTGGISAKNADWMRETPFLDHVWFVGKEFFWGNATTIHDFWWPHTMVVAALILGILAFRHRQRAARFVQSWGDSTMLGFFAWMVVVPVLCAGIVSHTVKPIFNRPRFVDFVLPYFLLLLGYACASVRPRMGRLALTTILAGAMAYGTYVQQITPQKTNNRKLAEYYRASPPDAVVFFPPWYSRAMSHYLDKPVKSMLPRDYEKWRRGADGREVWLVTDPLYNYSSYKGELAYFHKLRLQGSPRTISVDPSVNVQSVRMGDFGVPESMRGRLARWYEPNDLEGQIEGFFNHREFYGIESDPQTGAFRWAKKKSAFRLLDAADATTVVLCFEFPPPVPAGYKPGMKVYARRGGKRELFAGEPVLQLPDFRPDKVELEIPVPAGPDMLQIGWTMNPVNLRETGVASDDRDLGVRVLWVGVVKNNPPGN
ncbi:MAG: hypothetical protein K1X53_15240 [Candidatus Sumerlaeaceae bacterium]|nr:hypothetical protein [Candidatus Sumerlaeaceae bacterium]